MATGSQSSDMPDAFDNVAAALLREYLHLEKDKLPAAVRAKAEHALAQYQVDRALTAKELEAKRKGAEVRPDPPGTPRVDRTVDWLRDNQDLLQLLYESIRDRPAAERPTALCFSGGGIRSATFCLGVLQGLAREHRLEQFRYLSSVSGGGYIASWLSTLLVQDGATLATVSEILADSAGGAAPEMRSPMTGSQHDAVSRLRAYSNYLSPVLGLSGDMFALVSTFVRNLVLNLCVWLPLMAALLMLPRLFVLGMSDPPSPLCLKGLTLVAIALVIWGVAYMVADLPSGKSPEPPPRDRFVPPDQARGARSGFGPREHDRRRRTGRRFTQQTSRRDAPTDARRAAGIATPGLRAHQTRWAFGGASGRNARDDRDRREAPRPPHLRSTTQRAA